TCANLCTAPRYDHANSRETRYRLAMTALVNWFLNRVNKRTDPLPHPFSDEWRKVLASRVAFYAALPDDADREQLERDIYWFIEQKHWTPFDLEIDDAKKVMIAAFACLLINRRLDFGIFPRSPEIILRTNIFGDAVNAIAPDGSMHAIRQHRSGEAWYRGPIVLAWSEIEASLRGLRPNGNVIIHEYAHALDYLDGAIDGTPPLESKEELKSWELDFTREFEDLRKQVEQGRMSGLRAYGATNAAEFFAVATEAFFCDPQTLRAKHPTIYTQLNNFFRHDPARWRRNR
ncbi:MAG: zinc-dependent peptidase, partial [Phycisphaerae bacterium]